MGNDVIREALRSASIPSTLEPIGLLRNDGRRPDGATIIPWSRGKSLAWDFTCVHRLAASHLGTGIHEGPGVANEAETRKRAHYSDIPACYVFEPVAVETLGGIGDSSHAFLKTLSKRIKEQTGEIRSFAFLKQLLGLAIQRGNAACIMECINSSNS